MLRELNEMKTGGLEYRDLRFVCATHLAAANVNDDGSRRGFIGAFHRWSKVRRTSLMA